MTINLDFIFFLTSLIAISFVVIYLFNNFNSLKNTLFSKFETTNRILFLRYDILNNLTTNHYDAYNKYDIWIYCVEF